MQQQRGVAAPKSKKHVTMPELVAFMQQQQQEEEDDGDDLPALVDVSVDDTIYPFTLGPMLDPRVFDIRQPTPPPPPASVSKVTTTVPLGRFD